ncbi:MAG: TetR/AcrR family transcriptional regulator [Rhodospirillales bacterium]|nr:TetR/AcrR family transcriptional regulator [Rhodospirillales bacterium]
MPKKNIKKSPSQNKKAYHHGNLREALVDAAIDILENEGLKALSLRAVARRVGVSQTAPYHHFKDKEGMLAAVAAKGFMMMEAAQNISIPGEENTAENILALGRGYVTFGLKHPALLQLMFGPEIPDPKNHPELMSEGQKSFNRILEGVTARMDEAGITYVTPSIVTISAWSMVHGLAILLIGGKITPEGVGLNNEEELIEQVANVLHKGLT